MIDFLFGFLMGYVFGAVTYLFVMKIDKEKSNDRG
jgi:hypothetical protein